MRIYTRKGDRGETGTLGGGRLRKSDRRIRALGLFDELNAEIGITLAAADLPEALGAPLRQIQHVIFEAGAALAAVDPTGTGSFFAVETSWLESEIDRMESALPPLTRFILPGGSATAARLHLVRTVSRRVECQVEETAGGVEAYVPLLTWLNRLSDLFFVSARTANLLAGVADVPWESRSSPRGVE